MPDSTTIQPPLDPDRAARIRSVVESVLQQRGRGEAVSDESVLASHADLLPELARELGLLSILQRARDAAISRSGVRQIPSATASDASSTDRANPTLPPAPGGYSFVREIHRGGQGVVFEGIQNNTGRRVAIKVRRGGLFSGTRDIERFEREVDILAQLDHPCIVRIIDTGIRHGDPYFVMDYVDGEPLDDFLSRHTLDSHELVALFARIVEAVNAAHLQGVMHRDLKPDNILIESVPGKPPEPRLLDFGLARLTTEDVSTPHTITGQFVGSLPWASPEQTEGVQSRIDLRTDIYSLGVILFFMLTGSMPYNTNGLLPEIISTIRNVAPMRPSALRKSIPADLDVITLRCLAKEPARRYQSASELLDDLRRFTAQLPIAARSPSIVYQLSLFARRNRAAALGLIAVCLALAVGFTSTLLQLRQTRLAELDAVLARNAAEESQHLAEAQAYETSMAAAEAAFSAGDAPLLLQRLSAAPEHLRGWEWNHALRRAGEDVLLLDPDPDNTACRRVSAVPGKLFAAIWEKSTVRAWNDAGDRILWTINLQQDIREVQCARRADRILAITTTNAVVLSSIDGSIITSIPITHPGVITSLSHGSSIRQSELSAGALSDDGTRLITLQSQPNLQMFDATTGTLLYEIACKTPPTCVTFSPDGLLLALFCYDTIEIRSAADGSLINSWNKPPWDFSTPGHNGSFTFDGRQLVCALTQLIAIFDVPSGAVRYSFRIPFTCTDVAVAPSARQLAATTTYGTVITFDLSRPLVYQSFLGGPRYGSSLAYLDESRLLTSAFTSAQPRIWNTDQRRALHIINSTGFLKIAFDSSENSLRIASTRNQIIRELSTHISTTVPLPPDIKRIRAYDRSGTLALTLDQNNIPRLTNTTDHSTLWADTAPAEGILLGSFSDADVNLLAQMDRTGVLKLRRTRDGTIIRTENVQNGVAITMNPRGTHLAWLTNDGLISVMNTAPGGTITTIPTTIPAPWSIALSDDGSRVAIVGRGSVFIASVSNPQDQQTIISGDSALSAIVFSPDGTRLAVGGDNKIVNILDAATGAELLLLRDAGGPINALVWSDSGRYLAAAAGAGGGNAQVVIWDGAPTPFPEFIPTGPAKRAPALATVPASKPTTDTSSPR
jgi:serine/threonine protein kinase/WD40 repeat protein